MRLQVAFCAGEASGDLNGAFLASELKKLRGDLAMWGGGGRRMRDAGVDITTDMTGGGTISISQALKSLPSIAGKYFQLRGALLQRRPDVFVPIDFGAFNVRLAQTARKNGIPVVYYFPPSSWRKRPRNSGVLMACGGRIITPFQWSAELLQSQGLDARWVGHPLVDIVRPVQDRAEFLNKLALSESLPTVCLLPGSRGHELDEHLGPMVGAAKVIDRELGGAQFVIGASGPGVRESVERLGSEGAPTIRVVEGQTYDCIAHSDFLITKSGTATLEAAILGTPMIIIYRGTAIMRFEFIFRKSVLEDFIGMPNIIADRGVCPELINEDVTAEKLADISLSIMRDESRIAKMRSELAGVREKLGEPGAVGRAAQAVLEMAGL